MFLFNLLPKKAEAPDKPLAYTSQTCPDCGGQLIPYKDKTFCVDCSQPEAIANLVKDYEARSQAMYDQKMKTLSYESQHHQLIKDLAAERKINQELKSEIARLREENLCIDPCCITHDMDRLEKRVTALETLLHDLISEETF